MENLIQYIIYGILIYYFFFGGKKKKPPVESEDYNNQNTNFPKDEDSYPADTGRTSSTYGDSANADILGEVEKILGLPSSRTGRAEVPAEKPTVKEPSYKSTPLPNVKRQTDFTIRREEVSDPVKRKSHAEKVVSRYARELPAFDYEGHKTRLDDATSNEFVNAFRKRLKDNSTIREMFIFSEIINRPKYPRQRR